MRAATEGNLPPVIPQGNLIQLLGREVRQGSPGELMVESSPSRQRPPPCKTNKEMSDEAADVAALTTTTTPMNAMYPRAPTFEILGRRVERLQKLIRLLYGEQGSGEFRTWKEDLMRSLRPVGHHFTTGSSHYHTVSPRRRRCGVLSQFDETGTR